MVCPGCGRSPVPEDATYCPYCGVRYRRQWTPARRRWFGALCPLGALGAAFLPWLRVGLGSSATPETLVQVNAAAWGWCVLAAAAAVFGGLWLHRPAWAGVRRLWLLLAAASWGAALAVGIAVGVSAAISRELGAPNPVAVGPGLFVFLGVATVWVVAAWAD